MIRAKERRQAILAAVRMEGVANNWRGIYHFCRGYLKALEPRITKDEIREHVLSLERRGVIYHEDGFYWVSNDVESD